MKKALAIILVLFLMFTCVPFGSFTAIKAYGVDCACGANAQYTFDERTGLVTISGTGEIFGNEASPFINNTAIRNVVINNGITVIGESAFTGCSNLKTVQLPNTLTYISDYAFKDCVKLWNINLPNSLSGLGNNVFEYCTDLYSITVPNNAVNLGEGVFKDCVKLKSVVLPTGITSIKKDFFSGCLFLSDIIIPDSITTIENNAFLYCTRLVSINIPISVTQINDGAFYCCDNLMNIFYPGNESDFQNITVLEDNEKFTAGVFHYNVPVADIANHLTCTVVTNPTCENDGSADVICGCSLQYSQIIPALGHRFNIQTVEPTCTERGYNFYSCIGCDTQYYDDWVQIVSHSFVDGFCEKCGAAYTCPHEHTETLYQVDSTCEDEGYSGDLYCQDCNELVAKGDIVPCHYLTKEVIETVTPSGCEKQGYTLYRCTECSSIFRADYTYKDHAKQLIRTVEPTCEAQGFTEYLCQDCNKIIKENIIPALGHDYVNGVCSNCGEEPETLELYNYYEVNVSSAVENVFFKFIPEWDGIYYFYSDSQYDTQGAIYDCEMEMLDCNDDYFDTNFVIEYELYADEVYYFSAGLTESEIASFKVTISDEFMENHSSEIIETIEPGCVEYGYNIYKCSVCDAEYTADFTEPTGHEFQNGVCVYCHNLEEDCIESSHDYESNSDISWTVNKPGAKTIEITFSSSTFVENDYDFIYIYDKANNEIGCYTGSALMNKTIVVSGEKAVIRLVTDDSTNFYGFAVRNIKANYTDFAVKDNSPAVISNGFIYGLTPGTTTTDLTEKYFVVSDNIKVEISSDTVGTGTTLTITDKATNAVSDIYTVVIFGDINGDGYYDGADSVIADCISNRIILQSQISEAKYIAADCNKDGAVDGLDVQLLQNAGLVLSQIQQSTEQFTESSVYEDYISFIDQSPIVDNEKAQDTSSQQSPVSALLRILIELIKRVFLFIFNF